MNWIFDISTWCPQKQYNENDIVLWPSTGNLDSVPNIMPDFFYAKKSSIGVNPLLSTESWESKEFIWTPNYNTSLQEQYKTNFLLEDGVYVDKYSSDINCSVSVFSMEFAERSEQEARAIFHFLMKNKARKSFKYKHPIIFEEDFFVASDFSIKQNREGFYTISAKFKKSHSTPESNLGNLTDFGDIKISKNKIIRTPLEVFTKNSESIYMTANPSIITGTLIVDKDNFEEFPFEILCPAGSHHAEALDSGINSRYNSILPPQFQNTILAELGDWHSGLYYIFYEKGGVNNASSTNWWGYVPDNLLTFIAPYGENIIFPERNVTGNFLNTITYNVPSMAPSLNIIEDLVSGLGVAEIYLTGKTKMLIGSQGAITDNAGPGTTFKVYHQII